MLRHLPDSSQFQQKEVEDRGSSYRIDPDYLVKAIAYNRSCGISGKVFFFSEGLRADNYALAI